MIGMNDQIYSDKFPAIVEFQKTKKVDVSSVGFVWDTLQWETDLSAVKANKALTGFKVKVSKNCFLKVQCYYDAAPVKRFFHVGANDEVIIKIVPDAGNVDEDNVAFTGSTEGTITACVGGNF